MKPISRLVMAATAGTAIALSGGVGEAWGQSSPPRPAALRGPQDSDEKR
jgi:hypothetical protein